MNHESFVDPMPQDVLCIRDRRAYDHPGNVEFRAMVSSQIDRFLQRTTLIDWRHVARGIFAAARCQEVRFLRLHSHTKKWYVADDNFCVHIVIMAVGLSLKAEKQRDEAINCVQCQQVPVVTDNELPLMMSVAEEENLSPRSIHYMEKESENNLSPNEEHLRLRSDLLASKDSGSSKTAYPETANCVYRGSPAPILLQEASRNDHALDSKFLPLQSNLPTCQRGHSTITKRNLFKIITHAPFSERGGTEFFKSLQDYRERLLKLNLLLTSEVQYLRRDDAEWKRLLLEKHNSARTEISNGLEGVQHLQLTNSISHHLRLNISRQVHVASPHFEENVSSNASHNHETSLFARSQRLNETDGEQNACTCAED